MSEPAYSVVVPVFNSETSLKDLNDRIHAVFQELNASFEIIFVEDGSKDNSWKVLTEIKTLSPETITAIKLAKNFGQHNATFCGLNYAKGKIIITIDDDLQILPEEIKKIIECHMATDSDLVYGSFSNKNTPFSAILEVSWLKDRQSFSMIILAKARHFVYSVSNLHKKYFHIHRILFLSMNCFFGTPIIFLLSRSNIIRVATNIQDIQKPSFSNLLQT